MVTHGFIALFKPACNRWSFLVIAGWLLLTVTPQSAAGFGATAAPDKLDTDVSVPTQTAPATYPFSFSPAAGWTWYGDQHVSVGLPGVATITVWLAGHITVPAGVTDWFESEFYGELTPIGTGPGGGAPVIKPWAAYAWDHTLKIITDPMYVRVNGTGLTREGQTSASLTAKGPDTRLLPPAWSASPAGGISFSPAQGWTSTITNATANSGEWVTVTAQATKASPFSGTISDTSQVAVVDVNLASTAVTEANEESTGVFVPVLDTAATSGGVPLSLSIGPSGVTGQVTLTASSANFAVYRDAAFANALLSGGTTSVTFASLSAMPSTVYLKGITASTASGDMLTLAFTASATAGGGTPPEFKDKVKVSVIKIDFARLWDAHQEANRTTRAVDSALRAAKTYEDSERSDNAIPNDNPLLVLGGWCNQMTAADVNLKCQFQPATAGDHVLWRIDALVGTVDGTSSGNFMSSDTIALRLFPSTATMATHGGKDFIVKVGIDQNGDGALSNAEAIPVEWGIRVIGKPEYDHCRSGLPAWQITLGWLLYPDTMDLLDIFLDTDSIPSYQNDTPDTVSFSGTYDQKNGLGCDPASLTQGNLRRYTWQKPAGLRQRILLSDDMWDDAIQPTISAMGIGAWYANPANAATNSRVFSATFSDVVVFNSTENLANSLGKATVSFTVTLDTERATPKPKITAMQITGTVKDLYDFQTFTSDEPNGYASRIQVCYAPSCGRTAGKIFSVLINCDVAKFDLVTPIAYDSFTDLESEWALWIALGW